MRVLFLLASVCSLSLTGCGETATPSASSGAAPTAVAIASPTPPSTPTAGSHAATATAQATRAPVTYVALGDSYTIGTSVKPRDRWPNQLERTLGPATGLDLVENLAVNSASTQDVIDEQLDQLPALNPGFLSLLVGVNDVVRGVDIDTYRANLRTIFHALLQLVPAGRILVVTTPDYTLTPSGADYGDPQKQSARINSFNAALTREATQLQLLVVDITPISDQVPDDATLVAGDGLHPSAKQYAAWVELIAPPVRKLLRAAHTP